MRGDELVDPDALQMMIGSLDQQIVQLKQLLADQQQQWEADAREWKRLQRHRQELGEWLLDAARDQRGRLVTEVVDAGLRGEAFVPCTFSVIENGNRYHISLISTKFEIETRV